MLFAGGCKPEVDIYAPARDIYVVYGVLDPGQDTQYVRVGMAFQPPGDVYAYAGLADLGGRGLDVRITGDGKSWVGMPMESVVKDSGFFSASLAVYGFVTSGTDRIRAGERYVLQIKRPEDGRLNIQAETVVPEAPVIVSPGPFVYNAEHEKYTLNTLDFADDTDLRFEMREGDGYEVRVLVDFWDGEKMQVFRWGPSRIERESNGCNGSSSPYRACYQLAGRAMPNAFRLRLARSPGPVALYDSVRVASTLDSLSRVARVEVTTVDAALTKYLHGNTAFGFGLNLLMDKQEYSNISDGHTGIFGSINRGKQDIFIGECTKYLAGLVAIGPSGCN